MPDLQGIPFMWLMENSVSVARDQLIMAYLVVVKEAFDRGADVMSVLHVKRMARAGIQFRSCPELFPPVIGIVNGFCSQDIVMPFPSRSSKQQCAMSIPSSEVPDMTPVAKWFMWL